LRRLARHSSFEHLADLPLDRLPQPGLPHEGLIIIPYLLA
jgi:hypothetical protein